MSWWESVYLGSPPWDIGRPQPEIVELVERQELRGGRVLDIGCGLGDNSIFLVKKGFSVVCMDIAHLAIRRGKAKAAKERVEVDFRVGDALKLDEYYDEGFFDAVVDSGMFHTLGDDERPIFARQIRRVLATGGSYFMLCFSDKEPGDWGPRRVSKREIEETFSGLFRVNYIRDAYFATRHHRKGPQAYLASMTKV